jgi:hypothetical protein
MAPTKEGRERALKAWETIRRNKAGKAKANAASSEIGVRKKWKASDYPEDWKNIRADIWKRATTTRRRVRCECCGECLKHKGRCEEIRMTWPRARRRRGKVKIRITTAHLCHETKCDNRKHLKAMCEPCHQIYDLRCRQRGLRGARAVRWATRAGSNAKGTNNRGMGGN